MSDEDLKVSQIDPEVQASPDMTSLVDYDSDVQVLPDLTSREDYNSEAQLLPDMTSHVNYDPEFQLLPDMTSHVNYDPEVQVFPDMNSHVNYDPEVQTPPDMTSHFGSDSRVSFSWTGVSMTVPEKVRFSWRKPQQVDETKRLVKDSTGMLMPGEMLAIMGASGAGKTSLLNALTCRNMDGLEVTGRRFVNDCLVTPDCLTAVSAYLQQDDLFIGTLTVREHLVFQALVRMDRRISSQKRMERVDQLLDKLGLRKAENTLIGIKGRTKGISGGEMKRLALASELVTNPPLLFCDEPTSGLDSFMAASVVEALANLAREGRTVIFTIHQPSSHIFAMFDKLLLMTEGRTAYQGKARDANHFFSSLGQPCPALFNPADHFIKVLAFTPGKEDESREVNDTICHQYEKSDELKDLVLRLETMKLTAAAWASPYRATWWTQFKALLWRSWLSVIKHPALTKVRIIQTIFISFLIATIYYKQDLNQAGVRNLNGVIFFLVINQTFGNLNAVINVFCMELPIFLREHFNGVYRTDVYFITKQLAELPIFLFIPLLMTSVVYFIVGLNPLFQNFAISVLILELVTQVVLSYGYLISCITSSLSIALAIGPTLTVPLLLFGGYFLQNGTVPVWMDWIKYFSWILYGNEALLINQWASVQDIQCEFENEASCVRTGRQVLATMSFQEDNFWMDIVMLVALAVFFRVLAFLALLHKTIPKGKRE